MRTLEVENSNSNVKLSKYIFSKFPNMSKSIFYKALRNKDIKVSGKRITEDVILNNLDTVNIYISDSLLFNLPKDIDIIFEDENILVVFKPQGLLSNEEMISKGSMSYEPTLEDLVLAKYSDAKICHRLDRNTAGLVIFAKNEIAYKDMLWRF